MYMLDQRTVVLSDVELAKKAYQLPTLQGRPRIEMMEFEGVRHGIMLTSGQEWQEQRRFTLRHLRDFGFGKNYMEGLILEEVDELIEWLKSQEGKPVSINRKFYLAVINSLWTILAGKRFSHTDPKLEKVFELLIMSGRSINPVFIMFMPRLSKLVPNLSGWNKIQDLIKSSRHIVTDPVKEHTEEFTPDRKENPRDFIDAYLGEIEKTTDPNSSFYGSLGNASLTDVAMDLFQAGSMTTATMLTWAVLCNVIYPEAQEKLQKEIDEVIGKSRPPSLADRPK
ncbi:unnamed protein product [Allacma fusca]|uniref:Cytochrome P450 n=1 Tax=Allacma fusca TaxID=39272 RepID=A0A8J2KBD5_9HEXA|nr:unnamed protein product [Allacma fusca]